MKNILSTAVLLLLLTACEREALNKSEKQNVTGSDEFSQSMVAEGGNNPDEKLGAGATSGERNQSGSHVYLESNAAEQNQILVFKQQRDGSLILESQTNSGGKGLGAGLASEGALAIDRKNNLLFAVNAGSNSVSSFAIRSDGSLELLSTASSGGNVPISVTVHANFVYVVNSGSSDISGFLVSQNGKLTSIEGSHQGLSTSTAAPAQIAFSPDGDELFVTEKATNKISAFAVDHNGVVNKKVVNNSVGTTPFGFDFARGLFMVVSNADGGNIGTSTCTSYKNLDELNVEAVNGKVANGESSTCWVGTTAFGRFAFVANTGSNSISVYYVDPAGKLFLIPWAKAKAGSKPADIIVSNNNDFVYNINGGDHTLGEYKRGLLGNIESIGFIQSLPEFAAGLVSF